MEATSDDIRVIFTANTIWQSRAVRYILRAQVSHVYTEYPSGLWGGRWAAEATTHGGVRKVPAYKAHHHVYGEFKCLFDAQPGLRAVRKYFGEKYDYVGAGWLGIVALVLRGPFRWLKRKVRHPLWASKGQVCLELPAPIFIAWGLPRFVNWNADLETPQRIYNYCRNHPDLFQHAQGSVPGNRVAPSL